MHRQFAVLLAVLWAFSVSAAEEFQPPAPAELAMKDVPWAPGAPAVVLDWTVRHDDVQSRGSEHVRMKVLNAEGKKYGDVSIPYIPRHAGVRDIRARTIRPDGTVVSFDGEIYDQVLYRARGVRVMQKTFTLPQVEPGSIVEYRFTRTWPSTRLNAERWSVQRDIPVARASFFIRPYPRYASVCAAFGLPEKPVRDGDRYVFTVRDVPAFIEEPYSPPEEEIRGRIELYYTFKGDAETYWTEGGEVLAKVMNEFIGNRSGVRNVAQELTADATDNLAKLRRIYDRVQTIENLTFERDKTAQEEWRHDRRDRRHVQDVLEYGYGTRDEINRTFVGLARAAGFEAAIVMVSDRAKLFFNRKVPDVTQLPEEIAVVQLRGADRYFDPGTPFMPFGLLPWENTGIDGLRVDRKGGRWVVTPDQDASSATVRRTAALRLEDDLLKGTVRVVYGGQEALLARLATLHEDAAATRKRIEEEAGTWFPDGSKVKLTKIENARTVDAPLEHHFEVELAQIAATTGSRVVVPLSVFAANQKNPFVAERRKYDVYMRYGRRVNDIVTLTVPEGYAAGDLPAGAAVDERPFHYATEWKKSEKDVTLERSLTRGGVLIAAAQYPRVRNFYSRVASGDQQSIVLRKR